MCGKPSGRIPKTLSEIMSDHEKLVINQAFLHNGFSRDRTAASLGVSRLYLWRRMSLLGMEWPKASTGRPRKVQEGGQRGR
jgi:DNA-binding NtrC family response regulator